jgi:exopolyphosphatase/guanosine-5'-triphosphate,3'-diphosphate pyrophosphatase
MPMMCRGQRELAFMLSEVEVQVQRLILKQRHWTFTSFTQNRPMPQTKAVIDLGTNTFHLLIAEVTPAGGVKEIYRERIFVKLASEGIQLIGAAPLARGINALIHFRKVLDEYNCHHLSAIGTAALRTAANGAFFIRQAKEATNIDIELISGDKEARLITRGVLSALPPLEEKVLIMDIGGGSTEYIIADGERVYWRQSFPIGVSVLHNGFHTSDPISANEKGQLRDHLAETTKPLQEALQRFPTQHLAGAAGTFDVLADLLRDHSAPNHPTSHRLNMAGFPEFHDQVVASTLNERLALPGVPAQRVDMIVVAMILLDFTLKLAKIERVTVSDWAMKEGVLIG